MSVENTHDGPQKIREYLSDAQSVFFIGVGGVMMSSLALLTARAGFAVGGSDRTRTDVTESLRAEGIDIFYEHSADNLDADCGLVVYTVAISPDNPEYVAAHERGIPCVSRSDFLGFLMTRYRRRVGVAGMHGKSTCTSMCSQIFMDADADPTVLSGAVYAPMGGAYRIGSEEHFIFEACEYMDSFLDFHPTIAILLGAELEHVDYFKDMEQIRTSFAKFAALTGPRGVTVVNLDDPEIMESARRALKAKGTGHLVTFSIDNPKADFHAKNVTVENGYPAFSIVAYGKVWGRVQLSVPGRFQIYNCLAAAAAADACGIDRASVIEGLENFAGADRRMQPKGKINGVTVYDDYGHHPTEVKATLEGAKLLCTPHEDGTPGRLICTFQPHTYSRTAQLYDQFLTAFDSVDKLLLLDIYAARETDTCGVSSRLLAASVGDKAEYCPTPTAAAEIIIKEVQTGDVVVIMGAGDVIRVTKLLFP
ncbi:MAG: UDP-N-acetylmuramate--L-alanine ligase [Clostridia bacterium]|nr:UDP-N-acetylmuramate--L-alanine ligase [Clostridia bacterium]